MLSVDYFTEGPECMQSGKKRKTERNTIFREKTLKKLVQLFFVAVFLLFRSMKLLHRIFFFLTSVCKILVNYFSEDLEALGCEYDMNSCEEE